MKNQLFLTISVLCFFSSFTMGQYSKQYADSLVLNQLLANQLSKVDVYSIPILQNGLETITQFDNSIIPVPYSECWIYFIDNVPFANWCHSSKYIFVCALNGIYCAINSEKYPVDWQTNFAGISLIPRPTQIDLPSGGVITLDSLPPNPHLFAVLICGWDDQRYWRNISAVYNTLTHKYGYTKEHIYVLYDKGYSLQMPAFNKDLDGDLMDDIDYPAYHSTIEHTFNELAGIENVIPEIPKLEKEDQLFVYLSDHGNRDLSGHSYIYLPNNGLFYDYELAELVENISCSQMIYAMSQCFSGGFVDDIMDYSNYNVSCKNRSIHTASSADEPSNQLSYILYGNYDEFILYWTAAARGCYPRANMPWLPSVNTGFFPFNQYPQLANHPGDHNPDLNNDGFVQMEEAFTYADFMDTWSEYGFFLPLVQGLEENPTNDSDIGLTADLLTLAGYAGRVESNLITQPRSYIAGGTITVVPPGNFTLSSGTCFNLGYNGNQLNVQPAANLSIQSNVELSGGPSNIVRVDGNLQAGGNITFKKSGSTNYFGGLYLYNPTLQASLADVTFTGAGFLNLGSSLTLQNCLFTNCQEVISLDGNVTITNSDFNETSLHLENQYSLPNLTAVVSGCSFTNEVFDLGIDLWKYKKYLIENNDIRAGQTGIRTNWAGDGNSLNKRISGNTIHHCNSSGILTYNTFGTIEQNHIHNNHMGVKLMNNCNIALMGNAAANLLSETQQIRDNANCEVYASQFSFPSTFRYNAVIDEDNFGYPTDPLVFHDRPNVPPLLKLDVLYNCWGANFNPDDDLHTTNGVFKWNPAWCPGNDEGDTEAAEELYFQAEIMFDSGYFADAKTLFHSIIQQYPRTDYAQAAMKELFRVEPHVSSSFPDLKEYYQTNDSILADSLLTRLAEILINDCDLKLQDWPTVINWYEDRIINPPSFEDSIFAMIDLGYAYDLMETSGQKSIYEGRLPHLKPQSKRQYHEQRDYLLSLLPFKRESIQEEPILRDSKHGVLYQNVPNPFINSTVFDYELGKPGAVNFSITDMSGRSVFKSDQGQKETGRHTLKLHCPHLTNGFYFCTLFMDGDPIETKKMVVAK